MKSAVMLVLVTMGSVVSPAMATGVSKEDGNPRTTQAKQARPRIESSARNMRVLHAVLESVRWYVE